MGSSSSNAKDRLIRVFFDLTRKQSLSAITLDQICEAASAHRGSFYHAFPDKQAWAEISLQTLWEESRGLLDACFSPSKTPDQRIEDYVDLLLEHQCSQKGCVSGCPFFSFGVALGQHEPALRDKVNQILNEYQRYLETTIRDGQAEGVFRERNSRDLTTAAFHAIEGALSHARIQQSPEPVQHLRSTLALILTP